MLKGVVNKAPGNQAEGFILKVEAAGSHGRVWSEGVEMQAERGIDCTE